MRSKSFLFAFWFILILAGLTSPFIFKAAKVPDMLGEAPHFVLTDSENHEFDSSTLADKVWLINFFFTSCQGICPAINGRIAAIYSKYDKNPDVQFVSVSVDPDTDKPAVLKEYAKRFKANTTQWHFLTGPIDDVKTIIEKGFHLGFNDDPSLHSARLTLVDSHGEIRGYYDGNDNEAMQRLSDDMALLVK